MQCAGSQTLQGEVGMTHNPPLMSDTVKGEGNQGVAAEAAALASSGSSQQAVSPLRAPAANAHTAGPWQVLGTDGDVSIYSPRDDGSYVRLAYVDRCFEQCSRLDDVGAASMKMRQANARLIAAAPELLAVAQMLDAHWSADASNPQAENWHPETRALWEAARAAITKATQS